MKLETVLITNPAGGFIRINKADFNPSKHTLYVEGAPGEGGFVHVNADDPNPKCAVCEKPEPHSHVPTVEEYVAAGYTAEGYDRAFEGQKAGDVYDAELAKANDLKRQEAAKAAASAKGNGKSSRKAARG